jgi:Fe-S cluster assembly ATP-binding protein
MGLGNPLASVLAGRDEYEVTQGEVLFRGKICWISIPKSARRKGCSWRFNILLKSPASIPVSAALNGIRKYNGEPELDALSF